MSKSVVINGRFMEDRMKGLVRYARELVGALDALLDGEPRVTLLVPPTARDVPAYRSIAVERIGNRGGLVWEQTELRRYLRAHRNALCVNLCNVAPLFAQPGVTAILDIMYKVNPGHYTTLRNRLSRLWHCLQYGYITRHERRIITISEFCREEIERHYPASRGKIAVIPCAWQHVRQFAESPDWRERYPFLREGEFFFSLATLSKNKNGKWIIDVARKNPGQTFAMAGKRYETEYDVIPENVHLLGFISDGDACALMKHCRAFIFPSVYEGFGLPPLEALALGAQVISSNAASLPEVMSDSARYIDPAQTDVDLEALMARPVGPAEHALAQFDWLASARMLRDLMIEESG